MTQARSNLNGSATTIKKLFSRQTSITIAIAAEASTIWAFLTDASRFTTWNRTVVELTGTIAAGERIQLRSTLAPERTFKLKIKEFVPNSRLAWGDAMGTRTFELTPLSNGQTQFTMTEIIGGPLFPLFAKLIPPFEESFQQFASDLKSAAEGTK